MMLAGASLASVTLGSERASVSAAVVVTNPIMGIGPAIPFHRPTNTLRNVRISERDVLRAKKRAEKRKRDIPKAPPIVYTAPSVESLGGIEDAATQTAPLSLRPIALQPNPYTGPRYEPEPHWMDDDMMDALIHALAA